MVQLHTCERKRKIWLHCTRLSHLSDRSLPAARIEALLAGAVPTASEKVQLVRLFSKPSARHQLRYLPVSGAFLDSAAMRLRVLPPR